MPGFLISISLRESSRKVRHPRAEIESELGVPAPAVGRGTRAGYGLASFFPCRGPGDRFRVSCECSGNWIRRRDGARILSGDSAGSAATATAAAGLSRRRERRARGRHGHESPGGTRDRSDERRLPGNRGRRATDDRLLRAGARNRRAHRRSVARNPHRRARPRPKRRATTCGCF